MDVNMTIVLNWTPGYSINNGTHTHHIFHQSLQIISIATVIVIGFLGNTIMCVTLFRTPQLRTVTNIFTASLGLADLGIICFVLPMWITVIILDKGIVMEIRDIMNLDLCQATGFVTSSFMLVTVATVSGISLDKYFCICHPLKYPCQMTSKKVIIFLGYIWLQSLFLASTPLYGWGIYSFKPVTISICLSDWHHHISYSVFTLLLGLALPFFIMIFSYICIFQAARKQARRIQQFTFQLVDPWANNNGTRGSLSDQQSTSGGATRSSRRASFIINRIKKNKPPIIQAGRVYTPISKNIKTLKTVFIAVGVFVICWGPYLAVTIHRSHSHHHPAAEFVTTLLVFSISAINPIIFICLTRDFRTAVLRLLTRCHLLLKCNMSPANKIGPICEDKRLKITIMGQEASVQVIHLKQRQPSFDSGVETSSNNNHVPETSSKKMCDNLFQSCTKVNKGKYIPAKSEVPVLQCNGENIQFSDTNIQGSTSYHGTNKTGPQKPEGKGIKTVSESVACDIDEIGQNSCDLTQMKPYHLL